MNQRHRQIARATAERTVRAVEANYNQLLGYLHIALEQVPGERIVIRKEDVARIEEWMRTTEIAVELDDDGDLMILARRPREKPEAGRIVQPS